MKWQDPPPVDGGRGLGQRIDSDVDQLKERPGVWALVLEDVWPNRVEAYKRRGCQVSIRTRPNRKCDIYARWPA